MDLYSQIEKTKINHQWIKENKPIRVSNIYFRYKDTYIDDGEEYLVIYQDNNNIKIFSELICDTHILLEISLLDLRAIINTQSSYMFSTLKLQEQTIKEIEDAYQNILSILY